MTDVVTGPPSPDGHMDAATYNAAIEQASARGSYWTASRLFVALSAMMFGAALFAYFYLHSLDSAGLWRTPGQRPSDFISVPVLALTLVGAALFWGYTRLMLVGRADSADWRVATGVAAAMFLAAAAIQLWGMTRTGFYPGSSGYASVYVAVMPVFAVYCLGAAYWLETLLAHSLRVRWLVAPEGSNRDSLERENFAGSAIGAKVFVAFVAVVSVILFLLFSVLN
jgi:heme/copper-type cytochrome/quinol oxidase subunit 3